MYPIFETCDNSIIRSIPSINELKFIANKLNIERRIPNIFTIDNFVYCPKQKRDWLFIMRIYE